MFIGIGLSLIAQACGNRSSQSKTFGVTLSSVVGGLPASGSGIVTINQIAPAYVITPVITAHRSTGVAPLAVTFDALSTTAPALTSLPFSEIYYSWTFGDTAGGATWDYGTQPGVNLKNEAIGPVAAHVFETHGSYTVTCWAFYLDSGGTLHTGSSTTDITVTDPDTVFASNTIYISQSGVPVPGVDDGVPPGANVQQVTTWSTIATLAQTYKRILLKRGDTWVSTVQVGLDQISRAGPGIIGAYGTGAKPLMQMDSDAGAFSFTANCPEWRIMDIEAEGINLVSRPFSRVRAGTPVETLFFALRIQGRTGYRKHHYDCWDGVCGLCAWSCCKLCIRTWIWNLHGQRDPHDSAGDSRDRVQRSRMPDTRLCEGCVCK